MVGLIEDTRKIITQGFKNDGDLIALIGPTNDDLSVSEFAGCVAGYTTDEMIAGGSVPVIDLALELTVQETTLELIDEMLITSAHDCAEGGLAVAIAESCFSSLEHEAIGASIKLASNGLSNESLLFGESPSRIVISFSPEHLEKIKTIARDCPFEVIGTVADDNLVIEIDGEELVSAPVSELESIWESSLADRLEK
jgi:phosphoribosylformylglycinamidine synthase